LQAEAEEDAKFVVTSTASAYLLSAMKINPLPAGFVVPAQPVKAPKPPVGTDWVHEIKHVGYRIIVRRGGPTVQLCSRNASDWTARLAAIAAASELIKAKSFTVDGDYSTSCATERKHGPQSSMHSIWSSMMARIGAISHSWTARRRRRGCCAEPERPSCLTNILPRMGRPC
jgi:hypothetical protein